MNKYLFHFLSMMVFLSQVSCQSNKSEPFQTSYDYTYNGCPTGKHVFKASSAEQLREKLCVGLMDESANNFCAYPLRVERFNKDCSGMQTPTGKKQTNGSFGGESSGTLGNESSLGNTGAKKSEDEATFLDTPVAGEHQWRPTKLLLTFKKDNDREKTTTCSVEPSISLKTRNSKVQFSLGKLVCDSQDKSLLKAADIVSSMTNGLEYSARSILASDLAYQFVLNLENTPPYFIPPNGDRISQDIASRVKSLNALLNPTALFLDMVLQTEPEFTFKADDLPSNYYLEVLFPLTSKKMREIKVTVVVDHAFSQQKITLKGFLNQ